MGKVAAVVKKSCLIILITFIFLLLFVNISLGAEGNDEKQVIMLVVDGLSPGEWKYASDHYSNIKAFWDSSAIALLNTGTGGRLTSENMYVTLGTGARAVGTGRAGLAFNVEENWNHFTAGTLYRRYNGADPRGEVVNLEINKLIEANETKTYRAVPGTLGELIREAGYKRAVFGNADSGEINRLAVSLVMDEKGVVDFGDVSRGILQVQGDVSFGYTTDLDLLWEEISTVKEKSQFLVIDWGDTFRLRESLPLLRTETGRQEFDRILNDLDMLLERLLPLADGNTMLLVITPNPEGILKPSGGQLSLLGINTGENARDLLVSDSTRRPGLVTSLDIAPTVLNFLGISLPPYLSGGVMTASAAARGEEQLSTLLMLDAMIHTVYQQRPPLIRLYILLQILTVIGAAAALIFKIKPFIRYGRPLMTALMLVPLSFLLFPLIMTESPVISYITLFILTSLLTALFLYKADNVQLFLRIGLVITLFLVLDLALGDNLIKNSVMGYDPISGARFYGIGNEYMGVLVGASVLFISAAYQLGWNEKRFSHIFTLVFFAFILYVFISPRWGANFGGSVTALTAFVFTYLSLRNYKLSWKTASLIFGAAVLFVMSLVLLNLKGEDGVISHVGRSIAMVSREGFSEITNIITRKGAMNLKLLRYSWWSRVLLAFLGLMAFLFYQPPGLLKKLKTKYHYLSAGFAGIIVGSVTAILVNDSGVVAGATTLLYAGMPLLLAIDINRNSLEAEGGQY